MRTTAEELIVTRHDVNLRRLSGPDTVCHRYRHSVAAPATQPLTVAVPQAGLQVVFSCLVGELPGELRGAGQRRAFFDMDKLHFPLVLRNVRSGDRFAPLGAGGTQKLKKYFIDHKVPRNRRTCCPVLVSDGQIVWVVGHRIAEAAKVTAATTRVLKAEVQVV